ncbi:uncharacterized protein EI97DRAFT_309406 [Westerdykella ornata]|uniref:Uncharacterized protein n=1 Tax=Westerdykella ornata TaxID=318751 RepID=A0A6A6JN75_WESOR|nr:uncharacterized protein EI97DRAFT_309406 [Westerdykella ornata]KAF2277106.1 hypothetical protein EI97DRAFT_309406 [Westerdykella ornata]
MTGPSRRRRFRCPLPAATRRDDWSSQSFPGPCPSCQSRVGTASHLLANGCNSLALRPHRRITPQRPPVSNVNMRRDASSAYRFDLANRPADFTSHRGGRQLPLLLCIVVNSRLATAPHRKWSGYSFVVLQALPMSSLGEKRTLGRCQLMTLLGDSRGRAYD